MNATNETRAAEPRAGDGVGAESTSGASPTPAIAPRAYEPPRLEPLSSTPISVALGDLNVDDGNEILDIVTPNRHSVDVTVLLGQP